MFKRNSINVHSKRRKLVLQILGTCQNLQPAGRLGDYGHFLRCMTIADCRLKTAHRRLHTAECRLHEASRL